MREKTLDQADMSVSIESRIIDITLCRGWAAQFVWTGTPTGTVKVMSSIDGINFDDIPGASQATGGAAGEKQFNVSGAVNYPFIKLVYTRTAGIGSLTAHTSGLEN